MKDVPLYVPIRSEEHRVCPHSRAHLAFGTAYREGRKLAERTRYLRHVSFPLMLISPAGRLEGGPAASASSAAWLCGPSRVVKQTNEAKVPLPFKTVSALCSLSMYMLSMQCKGDIAYENALEVYVKAFTWYF